MSRWRPERIRLALHRDRAALVRYDRREKPIACESVALPADGSAEGTGLAIREALNRPDWRHGAIDVLLSHAVCRLALVPGGIDVRGREEEAALYRNCIEEANGDLSKDWRVVAADAPAHRARPACAIDGALADALEGAASASGGHVVSIRPFLVDAYNAHRAILARGRCWLVAVESERCCVVRLQDGAWQSLSVARVFGEPSAELAAILRRERLTHGDDIAPDGILLWAPNFSDLKLPPGFAPLLPARPLALPGGSRQDVTIFGMALEAAR